MTNVAYYEKEEKEKEKWSLSSKTASTLGILHLQPCVKIRTKLNENMKQSWTNT